MKWSPLEALGIRAEGQKPFLRRLQVGGIAGQMIGQRHIEDVGRAVLAVDLHGVNVRGQGSRRNGIKLDELVRPFLQVVEIRLVRGGRRLPEPGDIRHRKIEIRMSGFPSIAAFACIPRDGYVKSDNTDRHSIHPFLMSSPIHSLFDRLSLGVRPSPSRSIVRLTRPVSSRFQRPRNLSAELCPKDVRNHFGIPRGPREESRNAEGLFCREVKNGAPYEASLSARASPTAGATKAERTRKISMGGPH